MASKKLTELRDRIPVGTVLECVENTYRPVLNGTSRRIIENRPTFYRFVQLTDPDAPESVGAWPTRTSEITWLAENVVRWPLYRQGSGSRVDGHTVTFLIKGPSA